MAPTSPAADEILNHEFLGLRAKLIEIAAALDRIERGSGHRSADDRRDQIEKALQVLSRDSASRAETIQMIFSLPYDPAWRQEFDLESPA